MDHPVERRTRLLLVDDDPDFLRTLARVLEAEFEVVCALTGAQAIGHVQQKPVDIALVDYSLQDGYNGVTLMKRLHEADSTIAVILLSGTIEVPECVEAMRHGAADVLVKPPDFDRLGPRLRDCLPRVEVARRQRAQSALIDDPYGIFDVSTPMKTVLNKVGRLAPSRVPLLVEGEAGTGKRAVIQIIHQLSELREQPLLVVTADSLLTEAGAEAIRQLKERRSPSGSTLWLRDVDFANARVRSDVESMLDGPLRLLLTVTTTGDSTRKVQRIAPRLWERLSLLAITVPPIRERGEHALDARVRFFLSRFRQREGRGPLLLSTEARELTQRYSWPGNVSQMHATLSSAFAICGDEPFVSAMALRHALEPFYKTPDHEDAMTNVSMEFEAQRWSLRAMEHRQILAVLEHTNGHISQSAKLLGITRSTLYRKMQEFGISLDHV